MQISLQNRSWLIPLCAILIAASLAHTIRSCRRAPATFDGDRVRTDGAMAGAAVARHLGEGRRVLIVAPEYDALPAYRAQVSAFASALKENGLRVAAIETVPTDERGSRFPLWGRGVSGRDVLAKAASHANVEAVVVLLHVPVFPPELIAETAGRRPPIVLALADGFQTGVKELVEEGVVALALVSGLPVPSAAASSTPEERFERRYRSVTPENVSSLRM